MRQANAEIGVAFAGYFPAISLNGLFGYSGDPFIRELGAANPVWSFGGSLAQPLFNGGLTSAQVEAARETYQRERRRPIAKPCWWRSSRSRISCRRSGILTREAKVQAEDVRISRRGDADRPQ